MRIQSSLLKTVAVVFAVLAMFLLHSKVLKLWYDEAVQLSISHATHPESLETYRFDVDPDSVLEWNRIYNMDPGGYSFLLNLLSPAVGNRFYLYRFLSISLFILGVSLLVRKVLAMHGVSASYLDSVFWCSVVLLLLTTLLRIATVSDAVKMTVESLPLVNLISAGFSIRGYGLQLFLVSALISASGWYHTYSMRKYMLVALLLFVGCMVRYDFILFAAAYLLAILIDAVVKANARRLFAFPGTWIIALSALVGALTAYKMSYEYQMGVGSAPFQLPQLVPFILDSQESILLFLKSFRNITAIIVLGVILARIPKFGIGTLEILFVILFSVCMGLSFMGMYPFNFVSDRCLSVNLIFDVILLHCFLLFLSGKWVGLRSLVKGLRHFLSRYALHAAILTILCSSIVVARSYRSHGEGFLTTTMLKNDFICFEQTIDSAKGSNVFMDWWAIPVVNAGFQMKNKKMPPHRYSLGAFGPHNEGMRRYVERIEELKGSMIRTDCDYYYIPSPSWNAEFRVYMERRYERLPCIYSLYRKR